MNHYAISMFSLLIPVYNEQTAIAETLAKANEALKKLGEEFEIVVINDGSADGTSGILAGLNIAELSVLNHPRNRGYGAALKTGIRHSRGEVIAISDADGTYPIEELIDMHQQMKAEKLDMIVGARTKKGVQIPLIRRPAKAIVNTLANTLVGMKIPDTNSGLRIFTRPLAERFMHLYPSGFSFTMTITLAALTNDYLVKYHPIDYFKRQGKSSMSAGFNGLKNFMNFLGLIIRIMTYFKPIKFFMWPSVILTVAGIATVVQTLRIDNNISDAGMLLLLTGIQIGLFGLLAEVVVRHSQKQ